MSTIREIASDPEFQKRWGYIWSKLEPYMLEKQREYAKNHKGQHEQVGQFVEFMSEIMDDFNTIDVQVQAPAPVQRKRLHNEVLKQ